MTRSLLGFLHSHVREIRNCDFLTVAGTHLKKHIDAQNEQQDRDNGGHHIFGKPGEERDFVLDLFLRGFRVFVLFHKQYPSCGLYRPNNLTRPSIRRTRPITETMIPDIRFIHWSVPILNDRRR